MKIEKRAEEWKKAHNSSPDYEYGYIVGAEAQRDLIIKYLEGKLGEYIELSTIEEIKKI